MPSARYTQIFDHPEEAADIRDMLCLGDHSYYTKLLNTAMQLHCVSRVMYSRIVHVTFASTQARGRNSVNESEFVTTVT